MKKSESNTSESIKLKQQEIKRKINNKKKFD